MPAPTQSGNCPEKVLCPSVAEGTISRLPPFPTYSCSHADQTEGLDWIKPDSVRLASCIPFQVITTKIGSSSVPAGLLRLLPASSAGFYFLNRRTSHFHRLPLRLAPQDAAAGPGPAHRPQPLSKLLARQAIQP